jgi:Predicted CoA-binding protein
MSRQIEENMTAQTDGANWRDHLIESPAQIKDLLENTHRIAVLGIKPDADQPAHYVPEYAERAGYEIVPVPVYYKDLTEMMGKKVYRKIADIPGDIDMVNVFRRPTTSRRTSTTSSPRSPSQSGFSSESETTPPRSSLHARV